MDLYLDFPDIDGTPISVAELTDGNIPEKPHCHGHYQLALITKGSCRHIFKGVAALAAPGDIFLIPPHMIHCYKHISEVTILNCDFDLERIGSDWHDILRDIVPEPDVPPDPSGYVLHNHWQHMAFDPDGYGLAGSGGNALELQGIIHLEGNEYMHLSTLLHRMMDEQQHTESGHFYMKSALLQIALVFLGRIQMKKRSRLNDYSDRKKKLVNDAIAYIESHLDEISSSTEIAEKLFLSPAYFRSLFKDITGMTPTNYLNRMRIIRSLEYLEREDMSIAEAASKVGIYDSNYYSRLFKKIMGYSPRYFKKPR
ncbi:MAG: AraC family transcriptional regulator [Lachnospiraceae bacterium]|nr:AraC family transcriptional regulator [Lachnospiraceae bacterium]